MRNLTPQSRTYRLSGPVAAGTDAGFVQLGEIDMQGYNAVRVIYVLGTVVATGLFAARLKNYDTTNGESAVGSTVGVITDPVTGIVTEASDADGLVIHEVFRPQERFITPEYQRTVANVTINAVIVELFNADDQPVEQAGADVHAHEVLNQPQPSAA